MIGSNTWETLGDGSYDDSKVDDLRGLEGFEASKARGVRDFKGFEASKVDPSRVRGLEVPQRLITFWGLRRVVGEFRRRLPYSNEGGVLQTILSVIA